MIYSQWLGLTYLAVANPKLYPDFDALVDASCEQHLAGLLSASAAKAKAPAGARRRGP